MFGYVKANLEELSEAQKARYQSIYCGICHQIRDRSSQVARLGLSYDMAFLALLLMSLYEPEETYGNRGCILHPKKSRHFADSRYIQYAADMNVALSYFKAQDDYHDEKRLTAKAFASMLKKNCAAVYARYPRQCQAMEQCIRELSQLEKAGSQNPDEPAGCFGQLMAELMVEQEDMWSPTLRQLGDALGRYIYLADAAIDYRRDQNKGNYNPFLAMGMEENWPQWEEYLVLTMGRCTDYFEWLPLVQDKDILNNILYSGIWVEYRRRQKKVREENHDR